MTHDATMLYLLQGDGNSTGVGNPPGYCWAEQPPWSAYRESSFGHGTLDILNATHALWCAATPVHIRSCPQLPYQAGCMGILGP